ILTGYFNLAKIFEITLNNGFDPRTGKQIGPATGDPAGFSSFDEILKAFRDQVNHFVGIKISGNNIIGDVYSRNMPAPFLSLLIEDCIENGTDYNSGGARYNTTYIQGVGLGSLTDSLTSVTYNVFDKKHITMKELLNILEKNFEGYDDIRKNFIDETPKYGNDEDYPDDLAVEIFNIFHDSVNGRKGPRKSLHRINMLPTTSHVYFGSVIGALPDGRKKGEPLSEGISPVQSADRKGPSAVLKSASKIDHLKTGGTLLNQKFTPAFFKDENSLNKIINLIRGYFRLDGHHIQFNVIDAETLRRAQENPEQNRDLIVRVAGYSDYFVDVGRDLQNEIIARTEQRSL
ncbi:MAG: formate C-acetyltransferase/glycerol dehydratase family glycyl radical enzyme, partial [Candidatus Aminicenantes bacterium]|nr:formate C-acetyltransferase/glycerol dehydratase family glycyl radical enzyme [Candidatus Aminicenantes bacterium]